MSNRQPADLLPLHITGEDDRGRQVRVDAPAEVLMGDEPGAYVFHVYTDPDLPWPTRRVDLRLAPGCESDVALRARAKGAP